MAIVQIVCVCWCAFYHFTSPFADFLFMHFPLKLFICSRVTIKVVLRKRLSSKAALSYQSGDHVGIMADNRPEIVKVILERLANKPETDDEPTQLQLLQEKHTPMGNSAHLLLSYTHKTLLAHNRMLHD